MRPDEKTRKRLEFLCRVVRKESRLLLDTRQRLFKPGFNPVALATLDSTPDLADRIESFVARFGRLQDTTGDKLLPQVLAALGERVASAHSSRRRHVPRGDWQRLGTRDIAPGFTLGSTRAPYGECAMRANFF